MAEAPLDTSTLRSVAAISAAAGFLMGGYELLRSASTSLFIEAFGAEHLPHFVAIGPLVLMAYIGAYGFALSRWGAWRALRAATALSALALAAGYAGLAARWWPAAALLYLHKDAYIVLIFEQYWSFINSTLRSGEAKRLNSQIQAGATVGAIAGGFAVHRAAEAWGSRQLVLLAAAMLLPALWCSRVAFASAGEPRPASAEASETGSGLRLIRGSPALLRIAAMVALTQILSTALSLRFYSLLEVSMPATDARTAYLGGFWTASNTAALLLQLVAAPLLLTRLPLAWVHAALPCIHVATISALFMFPSYRVASVAFFLFKTLDYSVFRVAKELLYIPLSYDCRYRAKQLIDSFLYRASGSGAAGLLSFVGAALGPAAGAWSAQSLALLASLSWASVALRFTREPARLGA